MSSIKKYFDEGSKGFVCKTCKKSYSVQKTGTTSHLWTHLMRKHPTVYACAKQEDSKMKLERSSSTSGQRMQASSPPSISTFLVKTLDTATKKRYDSAVLKFIVADGRPFESAAGSGFKNLCSVLTNGSYIPPHPTTLSRRLDDMSHSLHEQFENSLKLDISSSRPSITFDHWKADNQTNYLVITIHYISELNWTLQSRCLSVVNLENVNADHTSSATEKIIRGELEKHGISQSSIYFATTDTTNTMPCTVRQLGINWQGCAAHSLQLSINAALDAQKIVQNLISHVHRIAGFFHSSTVGQTMLAKYQIDQGMKESKPPLDVITRFNSTFYLMDWIDKNSVPVSLALLECTVNKKCARSPPKPLTQMLQDTLKTTLPLLRPTAEATTVLSAEKNVSISLIYPCIATLKEELLTKSFIGHQQFRDELMKQLNSRFDLTMDHLLAATFVDPRFKHYLFSEVDIQRATLFFKTMLSSSENTRVSQNSEEHELEKQEQDGSRRSLLDSMFKKVKNAQGDNMASKISSFSEQIINEINLYSKQAVIDRRSDPLQFWKQNSNMFPLLAKAARNLLAIQATNCSSERVNSVGGHIITDDRYNLSRNNAETLIWAKINKDLLF
jgi:hypothetical protein